MNSYIPLSVPSFNGNEKKYVSECIETEWVSSAGKYVDLFEKKIANYTKSVYAIACVNGTSALQISLNLAGVKSGDEVIVPALTFVAPVNTIIYNKADPIFMDVDSFYNICSEKTIDFLRKHTFFKNNFTYNKLTKKRISAIIPVHIWGNAAMLDNLFAICKDRNIAIVEDASESLGTVYNSGKFKDNHTGTIGKLGCISFNGNKIITTGGGGMILTNSEDLAQKAKYLTTQAKDDPVNYIHNEVGYNFRLTNIQAALGVGQLEQLENILERKREINLRYSENLNAINGLKISSTPSYASNNNWLNILQIDLKEYHKTPIELMKRLEDKGIQTRPVWYLNHKQKPFINYQSFKIELAEKLLKTSLCLPSSFSLSNSQIDYISNSISN